MEVKAKAQRKGCITDHVRQLTIKTDDPVKQKFLADLHAIFLDGGTIRIDSKKPKTEPVILSLDGFLRYEQDHSATRP